MPTKDTNFQPRVPEQVSEEKCRWPHVEGLQCDWEGTAPGLPLRGPGVYGRCIFQMPALTLCSVCFEVWLGQGWGGGQTQALPSGMWSAGAGVEADQGHPSQRVVGSAFCNREEAWGRA